MNTPSHRLLPGLVAAQDLILNSGSRDYPSALRDLIAQIKGLPETEAEVTIKRHTAYFALEILTGFCANPALDNQVVDKKAIERIADKLKEGLYHAPSEVHVPQTENPMVGSVREFLASEAAKENIRLANDRDYYKEKAESLQAQVDELKRASVTGLEQAPRLIELMQQDADGGAPIGAVELEQASELMAELLRRVVVDEEGRVAFKAGNEMLKTLGLVESDLRLIVQKLDHFYQTRQKDWTGALDDAHTFAETAINRIQLHKPNA